MKVKAGVILPFGVFAFTTGDTFYTTRNELCISWYGLCFKHESFRNSGCCYKQYNQYVTDKEPIELLNILYGG